MIIAIIYTIIGLGVTFLFCGNEWNNVRDAIGGCADLPKGDATFFTVIGAAAVTIMWPFMVGYWVYGAIQALRDEKGE